MGGLSLHSACKPSVFFDVKSDIAALEKVVTSPEDVVSGHHSYDKHLEPGQIVFILCYFLAINQRDPVRVSNQFVATQSGIVIQSLEDAAVDVKVLLFRGHAYASSELE
jgi:hypothetical protein